MPEPTYWVDRLNPVLLHIYGPFAIRYYGLAYILGFVFAYWLMKKLIKAGVLNLDKEALSNSFTVLILGVFLGGRLGYCLFYGWHQFLNNPLFLFKIWEGGMSSHGGFIGVFLAAWWVSRKYHIPYLKLIDILAALTPMGLLLGRIANFINGELWGKVTHVPWAVIFPNSMPPGTPLSAIAPRHPSQLYEAALEGLLLLLYTQWRLWRTPVLAKPGQLAGEFLLLYALVRIFSEQFREPDAALILGMSRGIFYSLFMILVGLGLIWWAGHRAASKPSHA